MRDWFAMVIPDILKRGVPHVLDGDLPKSDWFGDLRLPRPQIPRHSLQSQTTKEEFHTVVPGRPIGLRPSSVKELAEQGIHVHFYGDFTQGQWVKWIEAARDLAPDYLHLHKNVDQEQWVSEFSQYDAGWLHFVKSENAGDLRRANWDDLNYPARIATLVAAGLPLLQYDNSDAIVATQTLARNLDIGIFFTDMKQLREQLTNQERMTQLRNNIWARRELFTFDFHVDGLIEFFRQVIERKN
jgi:hypothetical protein